MSELDYDRLAREFLDVRPQRRVQPGPLAAVLRAGRVVRHADGKVLCREGDASGSLYFLLGGKVRVERADLAGGTRVLTTIRAPSMVGHMALIDGSKRSATCTAEGPITLVELDAATCGRLIDELSPTGSALRRVLLSTLTVQLAAGNQRLKAVTDLDAATTQKTRRRPNPDALAKVDDILQGWDVSAEELDQVRVVFDQEQLRHWKGGKRPKG